MENIKKYRREERVSNNNRWNTLILSAIIPGSVGTIRTAIEEIHLSHDPLENIWLFRKRKIKVRWNEPELLKVISLKKIPQKYLKHYNTLMEEHLMINWDPPQTFKIR